ncbi:MAG: hypothetical protein IH986_05480 [Planctomycetes bacterium]|nr:hypothetical protein [Planctomycetota bacterium]
MSPRYLYALSVLRSLVVLVVLNAADRPSWADDDPDPLPGRPNLRKNLYSVVKRFDFDERKLGNFEDLPKHWFRLAGPGLPAYNDGRFDEDIGQGAAPSFRLNIRGGKSVGYEYRGPDVPVRPESDYLIVAHIRADDLRFTQAFVAAYLVDRFGTRIAGSDRVSRLVPATEDSRGAASQTPAPASPPTEAGSDTARERKRWERVELLVEGDYGDARALRLQLWIMQRNEWVTDPLDAVDPIRRQDAKASAWFDDIGIYRLPRARLRLTNPAALVHAGRPESFVLTVYNETRQQLDAELVVTDRHGVERHRQRVGVPAFAREPLRTPVPPLPPGFYHARLRLLAPRSPEVERDREPARDDSAVGPSAPADPNDPPSETDEWILQRDLGFAVLPRLASPGLATPDLGVDLGTWRRGRPRALRELLTTLHCGAIKIGVPMIGALDSDEKQAYFRQISELIRMLAQSGIESTGVILSPSAAAGHDDATSTLKMVQGDSTWSQRFNPTLASIGGLLSTWQLGDEALELSADQAWSTKEIRRVSDELSRFVTLPKVVVPTSVFDVPAEQYPAEFAAPARGGLSADSLPGERPAWSRDNIRSILVPARLHSRSLASQLAFLAAADAPEFWLRVVPADAARVGRAARLADLARRIVVGKAIGADRIFVPPPFELTTEAGGVTWMPNEDFIPLRTLFRLLAGKTAEAAIVLKAADRTTPGADDDVGIAFVFRELTESCIVLWTWRERADGLETRLYVGDDASAIDLWGRPIALRTTAGRAVIPLSSTPIILSSVSAPLVLLEASFRIEPRFVELPQTKQDPVLTLRNHYDERLKGTVTIIPPPNWAVVPEKLDFALAPGQLLEQALQLTVPSRQSNSGDRALTAHVTLAGPEERTLEFRVPLILGLRELEIAAEFRWDRDTLIIEHSLRNRSQVPVSFDGHCAAEGRAYQQRAFINVAPGRVVTKTYRFAAARDLIGSGVRLGVVELGAGRRRFEEVYKISE